MAVPAHAYAYGVMLTSSWGVSGPHLRVGVGQVAGCDLDERKD